MNELDSEINQFQEDPEYQKEERNTAMLVHLKSLAFPFVGFVGGPLIMRKRLNDVGPYLKKQWNAAFNFQLTIAIYFGAFYGLAIIIGSTIHDYVGDWFGGFVECLIGATLSLCLLWFSLTIRAAIRAKRGLEPPYPKLPFSVHQENWSNPTLPSSGHKSNY